MEFLLKIKKKLLEQIIDEFTFSNDIEVDTHIDMGHGRIETRKCSVISNFLFVENENNKW